MRLTDIDDVDIMLDENGQPVVAEDGRCSLVPAYECCKQDIYLETLTEEGELLHEDEEGRWAYGFGLSEALGGESGDDLYQEIESRVHEKLTKRDYVDADSIEVLFDDSTRRTKKLAIKFKWTDEEAETEIDLAIDGTEVEPE